MDYNKLRFKLEDELEKEATKVSEMTPSQLCVVKDLLCSIRYSIEIQKMDEEEFGGEEPGYSQRMSYAQGPGNSYARQRYSQPRNARGQYSGAYGPGRSAAREGVRYSRDDGKEQMVAQLEAYMNEAPTDRSRDAIRKAIEELERE